jgi:translation elongation factor EF-4
MKVPQKEHVVVMLCAAGVKCDLPKKKLTDADIQHFIHDKHIQVHLQTSAKDNINVTELFEEIVEAVVAAHLPLVTPSTLLYTHTLILFYSTVMITKLMRTTLFSSSYRLLCTIVMCYVQNG